MSARPSCCRFVRMAFMMATSPLSLRERDGFRDERAHFGGCLLFERALRERAASVEGERSDERLQPWNGCRHRGELVHTEADEDRRGARVGCETAAHGDLAAVHARTLGGLRDESQHRGM